MTPLCTQSYREIPLTRGQVAIVDAADYELLIQWKWHAAWNSHTKSFYATRCMADYGIRMHRQLLGLTRGDKRQGEHCNVDTLDNRRSNLRIATQSENMMNRRLFSRSKTGLKGATRHGKYWRAQIQVNKRHMVIGSTYKTPEDAHAAYCRVAAEIHGEFARYA